VTATVLVTGGSGYVGAALCAELIESGRTVRALDALVHGQEDVANGLGRAGVDVLRGDIRDPEMLERAVHGAHAVVHLAAIVGDPACARDPALAHDVNVEGSRAVIEAAVREGVRVLVFASTCSNYGRMSDPGTPVTESAALAPVSLYAEQKVAVERQLLDGLGVATAAVCLRFATVYGVAPRMRFDLTVNEFTRDLWGDRHLEVFGEQFWRPYIHVRDAGRAVRLILDAHVDEVRDDVFNVGSTKQNFRKIDLVDLVRSQVQRGTVEFVERSEDPRDYKVSFEKIRDRLGYMPTMTVADGIAEIASALDAGMFPDPFDPRYSNTP
jgi:nucleoside-diphosphate-sugar epimerase